jgi:hypothetical protein
MNIVDDRYDFRPAGTDKLLDSGFLDRDNILPLSHLERQACYFIFSEPAMICQNMFLATEAMGLGGWMHCWILSREIFEALGFKVISPHRTPVLANPIGLDGIFESYCPPYFRSMDAAVDAVLAPLLRPRSTPATPDRPPGPVPYPDLRRRASPVQSKSAKRASPAPRRSVITFMTPMAGFPAPSTRCT